MVTQLKVIMFTDQVNSTGAMSKRTTDEIRLVSSAQAELTAKAVSRCNGAILKDTGDGHMIEFRGCSDAVRCGYLIQQYVKERNQTLSDKQLRFELHVGIDFGEAVVLDNGDLRANAANSAARVSGKGPKGEVYFTRRVKDELHERDASFELVGKLLLKGISRTVSIYRLIDWLGPIEATPNPFIWRDGIARGEDFFGRDSELRRLRDLLRGGQNCQIVGNRRIGKSSLLREVEREAAVWDPVAVAAYVDQQDAACFTRLGWLRYVGAKWHWDTQVSDLAEFSEGVDKMLARNLLPVLCLDEFEELSARPAEFTDEFFLALRACGQKGVAILTASKQPLNELTKPQYSSSAFFNVFSFLRLEVFTNEEAMDFVHTYRVGVPVFTADQKQKLLEFAKCHPLALQVACYYVLEARNRESISAALRRAADEMRAMLPQGW